MVLSLLPVSGIAEEIFEAYPAPTLIVDDDVRVLRANRAARDLLGGEDGSEPLLGRRGGEVLHCLQSYRSGGCGRQDLCEDCVLRRSVGHALADGGVHRAQAALELRGPRGAQEILLLVSAAPVHHGEATYAVLTLEDVSELAAMEERSTRVTQTHETLLATMVQGVVYQDALGRILSVNPAAERILGRRRDELVGSTWSCLQGDAVREDGSSFSCDAWPPIVALRTGREQRDGVVEFVHPEEEGRRWMTMSAVPLFRPGEEAPYQVYTLLEDVTERRRAEEELRRQRDFSRSVTDSAMEAIFVVDERGRVTFANQESEKVFGYAPDALMGRLLHDALHHHTADGRPCPAVECSMLEAYGRGLRFREREDVFIRRDGAPVNVSCSSAPLEVGGRRVGSVLIARDVTKLKRAEEALRENERRYRLLFENMLDGLAYCRLVRGGDGRPTDLVYLEVNTAFERLIGVREVAGRRVTELSPAVRDSQLGLLEAYDRVARTGRPERLERALHPLGLWCSLSVYSPQPDHFVVVLEDITERKRSEEALRESRAQLEAALASMTDAVFISDARGSFLALNDAFARFHRFSSKTECATTLGAYPDILDVFTPDGALAPLERWAVPRALRGETAANVEYTLRRKDTGETWVGSYSFAPIREKGEIVGAVVVARDVTDRYRAEEALRASRERLRQLAAHQDSVREEEKRRIARELHDEMGQLLTALRLDVEALEEGLSAQPPEGQIPALLDRAVDASELAAQTVTTLQRVVAALRPASLDRLGLCPALRQECRSFEERTGVRSKVLAPDEPLGFGTEIDTALFRIAQEALTNVARHARATSVSVAVEAMDGQIVLQVEDDGEGIELEAVQPRSLGIVGMRERTERLGGRLTVMPGARGGTVVCARIPIDSARRSASRPL